jgi:hypothetical protein
MDKCVAAEKVIEEWLSRPDLEDAYQGADVRSEANFHVKKA